MLVELTSSPLCFFLLLTVLFCCLPLSPFFFLFSSIFFPSSLFSFPFSFFHSNERMKEKKTLFSPLFSVFFLSFLCLFLFVSLLSFFISFPCSLFSSRQQRRLIYRLHAALFRKQKTLI